MDRFESMSAFVKVIDLGSFTAAAVAMGISAPMVGKHIRSLEQRLGALLINRTTRRQNITSFGQAYYDRCKIILGEVTAAEEMAADHLREPRGRLRVAMPVHFGRRCVIPLLTGWKRNYPALELDLSLSDRLTDLVEEGFDLAIRTGTLTDSASLITRRLASQRMVVCGSPAYLADRGRPASIEDLGDHACVVYQRLGRIAPWLFSRAGHPPLEFAPKGSLKLDDLAAIAEISAAGEGLAWLPHWLVADHLRMGSLVELSFEASAFDYDVHLLWSRNPHLALRTRSAIDLLSRELPRLLS